MCAGAAETMISIFNQDGSDKDNTAAKLKKYLFVNVKADLLRNLITFIIVSLLIAGYTY